MKKIFLAGSLAVALLSVTACNTSTTEEKTVTTATEAPATAPSTDSTSTAQMAYICPMRCEGSASMEPGKCPVCKMDLEKNPAYAAVVPAQQ